MPKFKRKSTPTKKLPDYRDIVSDIHPVSHFKPEVKVVLYGRAGTGKTTLAATFPKPILFIDVSEKGTDSIRTTKGVDVIRVTDWEAFDKAYWYLRKEGYKKYKTVVIDTMSGIQDLSIKRVLEDNGEEPEEGKIGGWGTMRRQDWGTVSSDLKSAIMNFKELPMCVVLIAHDRVNKEEGDEAEDSGITPVVGPRLMPSVASTLNAAVGIIGNTFIREHTRVLKLGKKKTKKKTSIEYVLRIGPHAYYTTKVRSPKDIIVPAVIVDPSYEDILALMTGED